MARTKYFRLSSSGKVHMPDCGLQGKNSTPVSLTAEQLDAIGWQHICSFCRLSYPPVARVVWDDGA